MANYSSDEFYDYLTNINVPSMQYKDGEDYFAYKKAVKEKLIKLLGISNIEKNKCTPHIDVVETLKMDNYIKIRFYAETEKNCFVPCYFLYPIEKENEKLPLLIALQGHTSGMHVSLGETKDGEPVRPSHNYGIQAVNNGYACLLVEQRAMGEQQSKIPQRNWNNGAKCLTFGQYSLLLGRTLIGQRVWDVSRILDVLPNVFKNVDYSDITITGCSGGGTASYYIGCMDERITLTAPSCGVCSFPYSILKTYHCLCNYIPTMFNYFDQQDISCLIAPRKLILFAGENDQIFTKPGVLLAAQTMQKYYDIEKASNHFKLFITPGMGHDWDVNNNFKEILKMRNVK